MKDKKYDVVGIGSALMDFLVKVDDEHLLEMDLEKGSMHLVDEDKVKNLLSEMKGESLVVPGGSAANTLRGLALLGGKGVFCGKVGSDEHAVMYEQEMNKLDVKTNFSKHHGLTGRTITFVTPDSERTFATFLGASLHFKKEDILEEDIKQSKIIHVEGYQLEGPLREVALHAVRFAKKNGVMVSVDLADKELIKRNKEDLLKSVKKYADVVFLNEEEAKALTGKEGKEALEEAGKLCEVAVVKLGEKGSLIKKGKDIFEVESFKVKPVDTTGAGDIYAAGFLYGFVNGWSLDKAGNLGSFMAAKVVEKEGVNLDELSKEVNEFKEKLK